MPSACGPQDANLGKSSWKTATETIPINSIMYFFVGAFWIRYASSIRPFEVASSTKETRRAANPLLRSGEYRAPRTPGLHPDFGQSNRPLVAGTGPAGPPHRHAREVDVILSTGSFRMPFKNPEFCFLAFPIQRWATKIPRNHLGRWAPTSATEMAMASRTNRSVARISRPSWV